ncbi:MAG: hypothetical protein V5A72_01820 [Candidatus Nanohaloarchaea archaeon]
MNAQSKRIIALLTIVLIASGCTDGETQSEGPSTNPVKIDFEVIPSDDIISQQPVTAQMTVENTGQNNAENAVAKLFGPAWLNSKNDDTRKMDFGTLEASSETSFPVNDRTEFDAPEVDSGRTSSYNIQAQVIYEYLSSARTNFKFVSRERFRDQGYSLGTADIENSDGPIQLGIRGQTPIRYNPGEGIPEEEVCVTVENKGSGTPFTGSAGSVLSDGRIDKADGKNQVTVSITTNSGVTAELADDEDNTVDLIDGDRGWVCYDISANTGANAETTLELNIEAGYKYLEETSTGMTVQGELR